MKLIFLYGPPAAGKLTVGRELARLTGYSLHHNHTSIDWARDVFEFDTARFWRLVMRLRLAALAEMVAEDVDVITTFVYSRGFDMTAIDFDMTAIDGLCQLVTDAGGRVHFVHLSCAQQVLEERVVAADRVAMRKLASVDTLRQYLTTHDVWHLVPDRESLSLDTTDVAPAETARRIADRLELPVIGGEPD